MQVYTTLKNYLLGGYETVHTFVCAQQLSIHDSYCTVFSLDGSKSIHIYVCATVVKAYVKSNH